MSFTKPPLRFVGNKALWKNEFKQVIKQYIAKGIKIFVDVFGGSGYCSYMIKQCINELGLNIHDYTIIYNDFDNYVGRLRNKNTLKHITFIRDYIRQLNIKHQTRLPDDATQFIKDYLRKENETEPVDVRSMLRIFFFVL